MTKKKRYPDRRKRKREGISDSQIDAIKDLFATRKCRPKEIFEREDCPTGLDLRVYNSIKAGRIKTLPKGHYDWLIQTIESYELQNSYKPKTPRAPPPPGTKTVTEVKATLLLNSANTSLFRQLVSDRRHHGFSLYTNRIIVGRYIPAQELVAFFAQNPNIKEKTNIAFATGQDTFSELKKPDYKPPAEDELSVRLITRRGVDGVLPIVSLKLFEEYNTWMASNPALRDRPATAPGNVSSWPDLSKNTRAEIDAIEEKCIFDEAVLAGSRNPRLIAVHPDIARELKEKFHPKKPEDFIICINRTEFERDDFNDTKKEILANRNFTIVTRSQPEEKERFALIPPHFVPFLNIDQNGQIQGVKEQKTIALSFNASAKLSVSGGNAVIDVTPKTLDPIARSVLAHPHHAAADELSDRSNHISFSEENVMISGTLHPSGRFSNLRVHFKETSRQGAVLKLARNARIVVDGHSLTL